MFFALSKLFWLVVAPSNICMFLLAAGLVLLLVGRKRSGAAIVACAAVSLLVLGYSPLATSLLIALEERFPVLAVETIRPPDGIIVLGGWTDTEISVGRDVVAVNEAAERFFMAEALARKFPEARLVFTGGDGSLSGDVGNEADDVMRLMRLIGFDERRALFERQSRNTAENAAFTKALVMPKPGETWLLVTSAAHMPRSVGSFRAVGFDVVAVPVDFRTRGRSELYKPFRSLSEGLGRFDTAFREWLGLFAYWLSGRSSALFPAP